MKIIFSVWNIAETECKTIELTTTDIESELIYYKGNKVDVVEPFLTELFDDRVNKIYEIIDSP